MSFCVGFVRGAGNRLGERLGRAAADALVQKVERLAANQKSELDRRLTGTPFTSTADLEAELADLLNDDLAPLLREDPSIFDSTMKADIKRLLQQCLETYDFPATKASALADSVLVTVSTRIEIA